MNAAEIQRVALSTAANMCKKLPSDAADFVMEAVPLLTNLLQYHDAKVISSIFLFFKSVCLLFYSICVSLFLGVGACFCLFDSDC